MKNDRLNPNDVTDIRNKAEKKLKKKTSAKIPVLTEVQILKLIHELEVHQIELEMQSDELWMARDNAKKIADKFTEMYDFAYTGYFSLNLEGKIIELNLSGATLLGLERSNLIHKVFKNYVTLDTKSNFYDFFSKVFVTKIKETCEVRLLVKGNTSVHVYIEGILSGDEQKCLLTVVDVTKRKQAESILKLKSQEFELYDENMKFSEQQMVSLKKEINTLMKRVGEKEKYKIEN